MFGVVCLLFHSNLRILNQLNLQINRITGIHFEQNLSCSFHLLDLKFDSHSNFVRQKVSTNKLQSSGNKFLKAKVCERKINELRLTFLKRLKDETYPINETQILLGKAKQKIILGLPDIRYQIFCFLFVSRHI